VVSLILNSGLGKKKQKNSNLFSLSSLPTSETLKSKNRHKKKTPTLQKEVFNFIINTLLMMIASQPEHFIHVC